MIKAVILDVDGVIKGSKKGVNFPTPHTDIIEALRRINKKGIFVILCTGNYYNSILNIIQLAQLHNPHIADRGALIINPLDNLVLEKHCIDENLVKGILAVLFSLHVYLEVYSENSYFVQRSQESDFTETRATILQQEPVFFEALSEVPMGDIIKINAFTTNQKEKQEVIEALRQYNNKIATAWGGNPANGTKEIVNITAKGISKASAMHMILKKLDVSLEFVLGVGDSISDWDFMSTCEYVAAMGNASSELKELVKTKGEDKYFIAPHVDENGLLDVFKYFAL